MTAKKNDLLKCKTRADLKGFARKNNLPMTKRGNKLFIGPFTCVMQGDKFMYVEQNRYMATKKETLERLVNQDELLYWAHNNGIRLEAFSGGFYVDEEWQVNTQESIITSVERRMDEPREL